MTDTTQDLHVYVEIAQAHPSNDQAPIISIQGIYVTLRKVQGDPMANTCKYTVLPILHLHLYDITSIYVRVLHIPQPHPSPGLAEAFLAQTGGSIAYTYTRDIWCHMK